MDPHATTVLTGDELSPTAPAPHTEIPWALPPPQSIKTPVFGRRESLLTRQLHSETDHTDDEVLPHLRPSRTHSTWSNPSVASTAELTSDDGHSVASPSVSPPFPATTSSHALPLNVQSLDHKVKIVGQEDSSTATIPEVPASEKTVEAGLGRKRCITFACRGKSDAAAERPRSSEPQAPATAPAPAAAAAAPAKKCMLTFACPSRPTSDSAIIEKPIVRRAPTPPPVARKTSSTSRPQLVKAHRGSDSTITHPSPKSTRRTPSITMSTPAIIAAGSTKKQHQRKYSTDSGDSDGEDEAVRFHEFATSDDEPERWVQESTCHRSRLTVSDTLRKENVIRKACEEVEEEAQEEDAEAEDELDAGLDEDDEDDADLDEEALEDDEDDQELDDEEEESDDGFHSDDEHGFANSDDEGEDSDQEWWRPGGISTAATSVEHLDRLAIVNAQYPVPGSSVGSGSSSHVSPHSRSRRRHKSGQSAAVPIQRDASPDLPDSTDFVCGTLDEDRPLEQAYLHRRKIREAAKHQVRPQDIDPSFPTSDPEMDEEDDEDLLEPQDETDQDDRFIHGELEEMHGKVPARKPSSRGRLRSNSNRSARHPSPAPKKTTLGRSPAPPTIRGIARSPAPRKLFGSSPRRMRSPAPWARSPPPRARLSSPPNSPDSDKDDIACTPAPHFAQGNANLPTRTSSVPRRRGGLTSHTGNHHLSTGDVDSDSDITTIAPIQHHRSGQRGLHTAGQKKRGAIDIVKGLDKKRQYRKEKLYQKACAAKAAGKGTGNGGMMKMKPGRGAERMREIGLQLKNYRGRAEHILSL